MYEVVEVVAFALTVVALIAFVVNLY